MPQDPTIFGALRATESKHRRVISLDGIWSFVPDRAASGQILEGRMTVEGASPVPIAVPASWNEQLPELDTFLGPAWYHRTFRAPIGFDSESRRLWLRFGSVNYAAAVYVNGEYAGTHEGGHLPFEVDATPYLSKANANDVHHLVVRVDGSLERSHVPPGGGWGAMAPGCHPSASFDFYPFCGIQRSVLLCDRPAHGVSGLQCRVSLTEPDGARAASAEVSLRVRLDTKGHHLQRRVCIYDCVRRSRDRPHHPLRHLGRLQFHMEILQGNVGTHALVHSCTHACTLLAALLLTSQSIS